jgi:hypothetical protein
LQLDHECELNEIGAHHLTGFDLDDDLPSMSTAIEIGSPVSESV